MNRTSNLQRTTIGNVIVTTIRQDIYFKTTYFTQIIGGNLDGDVRTAYTLADAYVDHEMSVKRIAK